MKKLLTLFLALITVLSVTLVACNDSTPPSTSDDDGGNEFVSRNPTTSDTSDTDTDDKNTDAGDWAQSTVSKVYTMHEIYFRSAPDSNDSSKITTMVKGTELAVVAESTDKDTTYGNPLWYKVKYGEQEGYVSGYWVTANVNDTEFEDCTAEKLVLRPANNVEKPKVNLRNYPSLDGAAAKTIEYGTSDASKDITKIKESKSGLWFVVTYDLNGNGTIDNNETYYIKMTSEVRPYFGLSSSSSGSDVQG